MKELVLALTQWLNHSLGGMVNALLRALHVHPADASAPISETLAVELVIALLLLLFFVVARFSLSAEKPGVIQHMSEILHEFVSGQAEAIMVRGYEPHLPFVTVILLFVGACNLFGLLPGIETPTANPMVPLGIALPTFLYSEWYGIRMQGAIGYIKHLSGPIWWVTPLILPVEIISHLNRNVSLTIRAYANMRASDLLTMVFFSLLPIGLPVVFLGLHFAVALIQCYVFMLLALIYLAENGTDHAAH